MRFRGAVYRSLLIAILVQVAKAEIILEITPNTNPAVVIAGEAGHTFEKFCEVSGDMSSVEDYEWLHENTLFEGNVGASGHLLIDPVSLEHAGDYFCRGRLTDGVTDPVFAGNLTVLEPDVVVAPPIQYVLLNGSTALSCSITDMEPAVVWTFDGEPVDGSIEAATWGDEGTYSCRLSSAMLNFPVMRDIELRIVVSPAITSTPDSLYDFTADNFTSTFTLQFEGRETDTVVTWMRNNTRLSSEGEGYRIETSYDGYMDTVGTTSLVFTEECVWRSLQGVYTVTIANENDVIPEGERRVQYSFEVGVTALPAPMTDIMVTPLSTTTARITWSATYCHGDTEPERFTVTLETDNRTQSTTRSVAEEEWEEMEYVVRLDPGKMYWISLEAENEDGVTSSDAVPFELDPASPLIISKDISRINETAYEITTQLNYTGGGSIDNFTVTFRMSGEEEWDSSKTIDARPVPDSNDLRWIGVIVNSSFAIFSRFEFQVMIMNARGLTASTGELQETQVLPGRPTHIEVVSTTETTAVLEVELSSQGTPPLIVVMEPTSHTELDTLNITTYLRGDTVRFHLDELSKGTTYTVNVYAENLEGRGPGDQASFSTDGPSTLLPLWLIVLISVCGVLGLAILALLFFLLCYCGYRARRSKREYYTGPIELTKQELEPANPMITRSIRSNGYAGSTSSFTPRSPTGLSNPSPGFFDDNDGSRPFDEGSPTSPLHYRNRLDNMSTSEGTPSVVPSTHKLVMGESYSSLPRQWYQQGSQDAGATSPKTATLSPPPAPKSCATDV